MFCFYGCGQEAKYQFKNGKWCCSPKFNYCPQFRKTKSLKLIGKPSGMLGKHLSISHKKKISIKLKGKIVSEETRKKMSDFQAGKIVSTETRKKMSEGRIGKYKKESNPNWKGGYHTNGIPQYDIYANQIFYVEEVRRNIEDRNIIEVRCTYNNCRKWFIPSLGSIWKRIECLNTKGMGESHFYCSEKCKKKCILFGLHHDLFEKKISNKKIIEKDYQTFRLFVLERDNNTCQFCGKEAVHVHHERPQKLEPFFALDPDYAWSCCKKCHYEKGHRDECSTGNLAKNEC
mgnify:CR=1 FL=1